MPCSASLDLSCFSYVMTWPVSQPVFFRERERWKTVSGVEDAQWIWDNSDFIRNWSFGWPALNYKSNLSITHSNAWFTWLPRLNSFLLNHQADIETSCIHTDDTKSAICTLAPDYRTNLAWKLPWSQPQLQHHPLPKRSEPAWCQQQAPSAYASCLCMWRWGWGPWPCCAHPVPGSSVGNYTRSFVVNACQTRLKTFSDIDKTERHRPGLGWLHSTLRIWVTSL